MKSSFNLIQHHGRPVSRNTALVAFGRGEHFDPTFTGERPRRRNTLDNMPRPARLPEGCFDFSGTRRGRMIAIAYHHQSLNKKYAVWVCRCDCGKYEFRRPARWLRKAEPNDMCDECLREQEILQGGAGKSKRTHAARLKAFIDMLTGLGLTGEEAVRVLDADITIKGMNVSQIRSALASKETANG